MQKEKSKCGRKILTDSVEWLANKVSHSQKPTNPNNQHCV